MPGKMAPPRKAAVGSEQVDGDGRADIDHNRRAIGRPQAIGGQPVQQAIDADHVRPGQFDDQRQIARGQQADFIVSTVVAKPVDQPRRGRAIDAADVPAECNSAAGGGRMTLRDTGTNGCV